MNRPFYAFGVLLFLLAAAMLAVSSTSRSTTVRPRAAASKAELPSRRSQPAGIYVIVLPADEGTESNESSAEYNDLAIAETRTNGEQADANAILPCILGSEVELPSRPTTGLVGVRIEPANDDIAGPQTDDQCRPLEEGDNRILAEEPADGFRQSVGLNTEEVVEIFQSICRSQSLAAKEQSRWRVGNFRTMLLGLNNWLMQKIQQTGWTQRWPVLFVSQGTAASPLVMDWRDYGALMDQAIGIQPAGSRHLNAASVVPAVRSGRWLFDFAALLFGQLQIAVQATSQQFARFGVVWFAHDSAAVSR